MSRTMIGARPRLISSHSSSRGLDISARPIATICCWPPDSEVLGLVAPLRQHREKLVDTRCSVHGPGRPSWPPMSEVLLDRERGKQPAAFGNQRDAARDDLRRPACRRSARLRTGSCRARRGSGRRCFEQRALAGAVGPDDRHHLAGVDLTARRRTAPGSRRKRRSAIHFEQRHRVSELSHACGRRIGIRRPRSPCRFRRPRAGDDAAGRSSAMNLPPASTTSRSTAAKSACTMCSIQMIETPVVRIL